MGGSYGGFDGGSDGSGDGFDGLDGGGAGNWLKRVTAESKSDDERADGWTHKIREGRVDGLIFLDDVVQVVTWASTKRVESLVDSMALMARIDSLECGADGGFDGRYDGGSDGFEPKQRRDNCKRRSRGYQGKMPEWETMQWINSGADEGFGGGFDGLDGFDGGAVGVAESDGSRAQKR